jgi:hypothetical protein
MMKTKIGLYPNPPHRAALGNTGKAFGDQAWNIHPRFFQMLCHYVRPPTSAGACPKGKLLMIWHRHDLVEKVKVIFNNIEKSIDFF